MSKYEKKLYVKVFIILAVSFVFCLTVLLIKSNDLITHLYN